MIFQNKYNCPGKFLPFRWPLLYTDVGIPALQCFTLHASAVYIMQVAYYWATSKQRILLGVRNMV
jgi:hypothetical protein